jgi:predicted DCC family thiol-disulfide oxidoreductase YuxK
LILRHFDNIVSKACIGNNIISENEFKKIGLLRICTGFVIFFRFFEIFISEIYLNVISSSTILLFIFLLIVLCLTVGFFTPVANVFTFLLVPIIDAKFNTNTLGSTIAIEVLIGFFLLNAGQYFSVDARLFNLNKKKFPFLKFIYSGIGVPNKQEVKRAYFLIFILYGISSFFALLLHMQDSYWISGVSIRAILTNTYLCKHALFFRNMEFYTPGLLDIISVTGIVFQSLFQICMLFLVFFRWGARFVKLWGFLFFIISFCFFSLSYLPHLELILWIIIFCPLQTSVNKIEILYNDKCNSHRRSMFFLKSINISKKYQFLPVHEKSETLLKNSLSIEDVSKTMTGIYKGKIFKGYDLYFLISYTNPLLFLFAPILFIARILFFGPFAYNLIAKHRYKIFGTGKIPDNYALQLAKPPLSLKKNSFIGELICLVLLLNAVLFACVSSSVFRKNIRGKSIIALSNSYKSFSKHFGIEVPIVFNKVDLSMGDHFMVIKKWTNDKWVVTPITSPIGERLNYSNFDYLLFSNHNSDLIYFGQTLKYRRKLISEKNIESFHENGFGKDYINFLIKYDYRLSGSKGKSQYKVEVFRSNSSKVALFKNDLARFELNKVYEKYIIYPQ